MTKHERRTVNDAAQILTKELLDTGEVTVKGFGKFYLTTVFVSGNGFGHRHTHMQSVVKFRPWTALKDKIKEKTLEPIDGESPPTEAPQQEYREMGCPHCESVVRKPDGTPYTANDDEFPDTCSECGLPIDMEV